MFKRFVQKNRFLLISLQLLATASLAQGSYCLALRGNGELAPAHWGAIAQTVETFGIPQAMAGGSSASISTFLLESVLLNPHLSESPKDKARDVAFLVKSFEGFVYSYTDRSDYQKFFEMLRALQGSEDGRGVLDRLKTLIDGKSTAEILLNYREVKELINQLLESQVFYGKQVESFHRALKEYLGSVSSVVSLEKWRTLQREQEKLRLALEVFGKFDAKNDQTLFVRDGIINFTAVSEVFDFVANFYSLRGASEQASQSFSQFLRHCAPGSEGMSWRQIVQAKPECQQGLVAALRLFDINRNKSRPRLDDEVGMSLPAFISTSVVVGPSYKNLVKIKEQYGLGLKANYDFQLASQDLKFGYWGRREDLQAIQDYFLNHPSELIVSIDKSKRFMPLGQATWKLMLTLSPAEPGLSPMLPFLVQGREVMSLGGWSDLHPVPILKAKGCEKVIYLTRKGGDSIFAQGVAKRLLGFAQLPWEELDPADSDSNLTQTLNNRGRTGAVDEGWSQMFNLANPRSSFGASLLLADAVVCTNWNGFDVKKDFKGLIEESYRAPVFMSNPIALTGLRTPVWITKADNALEPRLSKTGQPLPGQDSPRFAGCIPQDF